MLRSDLIKAKFDPEILPDKDDPNSYCRSCDKSFAQRQLYMQHLQRIYKLQIIKARPNKLTMKPNIDYPNFCCQVCKTIYSSRKPYRRHRMDLAPSIDYPKYDPNIKLDINTPTKNCCASCNLTFRKS